MFHEVHSVKRLRKINKTTRPFILQGKPQILENVMAHIQQHSHTSGAKTGHSNHNGKSAEPQTTAKERSHDPSLTDKKVPNWEAINRQAGKYEEATKHPGAANKLVAKTSKYIQHKHENGTGFKNNGKNFIDNMRVQADKMEAQGKTKQADSLREYAGKLEESIAQASSQKGPRPLGLNKSNEIVDAYNHKHGEAKKLAQDTAAHLEKVGKGDGAKYFAHAQKRSAIAESHGHHHRAEAIDNHVARVKYNMNQDKLADGVIKYKQQLAQEALERDKDPSNHS